MKTRYPILFLAILLVYSSCEKKETATPAVKPVIDSVKKADTVKQASIYPYTDTFTGYLQNYVSGPPDFSNKDSSFIFFVHHVSAGVISFQNPNAIQLDQNPNINLILGFGVNIDSSNTYFYYPDPSNEDTWYAFSLIKDSLYVHWDYGVNCWYYEYTGNYSGKCKRQRR